MKGMTMSKKAKEPKIIGWKVTVFEDYPPLGRIKKFSFEYGNSPIRDKRSREACLAELDAAGADYEVTPIYPWVNPYVM